MQNYLIIRPKEITDEQNNVFDSYLQHLDDKEITNKIENQKELSDKEKIKLNEDFKKFFEKNQEKLGGI